MTWFGSCSRRRGRRFWSVVIGLGVAWGLLVPEPGFAAETVANSPTKTTQVIFSLDTRETPQVRTRGETQPPAIVLEFPGQQVAASLPERSVIQHGVIAELRTHYRTPPGPTPTRIIEFVRIGLTGPYQHRVSTRPGHVLVDIDHPVGVTGETVEIGLRGGTILSGLARSNITDRFRAMQEAMAKASPTTWTWRAPSPKSLVGGRATRSSGGEAGATRDVTTPEGASASAQTGVSSAPTSPPPQPPRGEGAFPWVPFMAMMVALVGAATVVWWLWDRRVAFGVWRARAARPRAVSRPPATVMMLIDQLVWRAFERRGYQLSRTMDVAPLQGTLRVIIKEAGEPRALFCLTDGPFVEQHTIDECLRAMRQASGGGGFIVVSGSFTVPAQRRAKEVRLTLLGREELVELLSDGATTEYFTRQLAELQVKLDESEERLKRSTRELEAIRRQRNESSWVLGEERAKRATLEREVSELTRRIQASQTAGGQSQEEVATLRRQWEESEWYLGEARARIRYFEEQVSRLQEIAQTAEATKQERDKANWYLGEEHLQREQLTAQLQALTTEIKQRVTRERALKDQMDRLKEELDVLQAHGERRKEVRGYLTEGTVELRDRRHRLIVSGDLSDLSGAGVGFDSERAWAINDPIQILLRLPGRVRPITSQGRLVWQRRNLRTAHYRSGCRFIDLSAANRAAIEHAIAPLHS